MAHTTAVLTPNPVLPNHVIKIDPEKCCACYQCADICRCNVIMPNPVKGQPPLLVYPDECWHCAVCTEHCPTGAIEFEHPINQKVTWKRKDTGEMFRIGMKNPPPPYTKRAYGDRHVYLDPSKDMRMRAVLVERVARYVIHAVFETTGEEIPAYRAGSFCNVRISDDAHRGYSIANPHNGRTIELFVDVFGGGPGARFFETLTQGAEVEMTVPLGRFCYTPAATPLLLVGSVTGISPAKAMLEQELFREKSGRPIHLLFQVWDEPDVFLKDYLDDLADRFPQFTYEIVFASMAQETGITIPDRIARLEMLTPDSYAYICGSKPLIKAAERALFDRGLSWLRISYESFLQ